MKLENCIKIYDCLAEQGDQGKSIATLSSELDIAVSEVEKCLAEFSCFVQVDGTQNHIINPASVSDKESLIKAYKSKEKSRNGFIFWFLIFFTITMSLIAILNSSKN